MGIEFRFDRSLMDEIEKMTNDIQRAYAHMFASLHTDALWTHNVVEAGISYEDWNEAWADVHYFVDRLGEHIAELEHNVDSAYKAAQDNIKASRTASVAAKGNGVGNAICVQCKRPYNARWPNQLYCSPSCRTACRKQKRGQAMVVGGMAKQAPR